MANALCLCYGDDKNSPVKTKANAGLEILNALHAPSSLGLKARFSVAKMSMIDARDARIAYTKSLMAEIEIKITIAVERLNPPIFKI